eukprot:12832973-Alexandrium_andersonii.AAC.1
MRAPGTPPPAGTRGSPAPDSSARPPTPAETLIAGAPRPRPPPELLRPHHPRQSLAIHDNVLTYLVER